ncbi:hypothetical protein QD47_22980 [Paenibacillus terrae]|uniref:Uncharacterized protein n=2 Tax=Paenibacillus terrae TaxID=159743 RepID=A0A0D7WW06_9BACL|nr:hypothetical protein QD47_22980 [Paenibacillus terrae]
MVNVIRENYTNGARNRMRTNNVYINETLHLEQIISDLRVMGYVAFHHHPQITGELEELEEMKKQLLSFFQQHHVLWIELDPLTQYAVVNNMGKATVLKLIGRKMNPLRDLRANAALAGQPLHELDREIERLNRLVHLLRYTRFS